MWECETQRVNETAAAALASAEEMKGLKGNALSPPPPPPPRVLVTWYGWGEGGSTDVGLDHQRWVVKQNIQ